MVKKIILIVLAICIVNLAAGIIYFEIEPENTDINFAPADPQNTTDTTIRFNSDGKLKILHIADPHLANDKHFDSSIWVIANACDVEKPDLVVLTGDNTKPYDDPEETKKLIN